MSKPYDLQTGNGFPVCAHARRKELKMKTEKKSFAARLAAAALAMAIAFGVVLGGVPAVRAEAALSKPANCRFYQWLNTSFNKCELKWDKVSGASGYQTTWYWTDGTHKKTQNWKGQSSGVVFNVPNNRMSIFKVRAYKTSGGKTTYSDWSNAVYIVPSPTTIKWNWAYKKGVPYEKFEWNRVIGTSGYRIYMTTDRSGKWYSVKTVTGSTTVKANISKYRGSKFKIGKKDQYKYYFRIVSLRKVNGKYVEAPLYSKTYGPGYFYFSK